MAAPRTTTATSLDTLAMLAVVQHAVDHGLPLGGIDTPVLPSDPITIRVHSGHLDAWLDTVTVVDPAVHNHIESMAVTTVRQRVTVPSPIGDVRVEIWSTYRTPSLLLVPGGAA